MQSALGNYRSGESESALLEEERVRRKFRREKRRKI
jgi:hypothetical protein